MELNLKKKKSLKDNSLRHEVKWKPVTAEVKGGFLRAGCERMNHGLRKCLVTFRESLGGQVFFHEQL